LCPKMKNRLYLVDSVFVIVLLSVMAWDLVTRGWASTHGLFFVVGILSVASLAVADRLSAGIGSVRLVTALGILLALPVFELAGGGAVPHLLVFLAVVFTALVCSVTVLIKVDRIQGVCALSLTIWALAIGISNALSTHSYTGFWTSEIV
jgi:hypothetical protein